MDAPKAMDKAPVKIALAALALVLALALLAYGVKSAGDAEGYAPSPGLDGNARAGSVGSGGVAAGGSAPGMPGGPPPDTKPGSVR